MFSLKINTILESQTRTTSNISNISTTLDHLSSKLDDLHKEVHVNEVFYDRRFSLLETRYDQLCEGLDRLYDVIKTNHDTTTEQREFFEGKKDGNGGGGRYSGANQDKSVEDNSTKGEKASGTGEKHQGSNKGESNKGEQLQSGKDKGKANATASMPEVTTETTEEYYTVE